MHIPVIIKQQISETEFLEVIPIHHCQNFARECCNLLNSEWPRSVAARLQSLLSSSENFPISLVLILDGQHVVGHVKLSEVRLKGPEVMLESMIIQKQHRRKGWGKILMTAAEKYIERVGKTKIYLSTKGQEGFYSKLGYEICDPIFYFGYCDLTPRSDGKFTPRSDGKVENIVKNVPKIIDMSIPLPPPPPPPPLPQNNKKSNQIYKTSKTFMSKEFNSNDPEH